MALRQGWRFHGSGRDSISDTRVSCCQHSMAEQCYILGERARLRDAVILDPWSRYLHGSAVTSHLVRLERRRAQRQ